MTLSHLDARLVAFEAELFERNGRQVQDRIREAFRTVRRDRFVQEWFERGPGGDFERRSVDTSSGSFEERLAAIYSDRPLVTAVTAAGAAASSSSQPSLMMMMLVHLDPKLGMRVLEVGAGTGYNAALLASITGSGGSVVSVEIDSELAERAAANLRSEGVRTATVLVGDGALGWAASGPYDRIIVTVGAQVVHDEWVAQLTEGGRVVLPLDHSGSHVLTVLNRAAGAATLSGYFAGWSSFVAGLGGLRFGPRVSMATLAAGRRLVPVAGLPRANDFADFAFFTGLEHPDLTTVRIVDADGELLHVGPGIVDARGEVAALAPECLRVTVDDLLADRVRATVHRWEVLGRPRLADYEVALDRPSPAPTGMVVQWRRPLGSHTEVVTLQRPGPLRDVTPR